MRSSSVSSDGSAEAAAPLRLQLPLLQQVDEADAGGEREDGVAEERRRDVRRQPGGIELRRQPVGAGEDDVRRERQQEGERRHQRPQHRQRRPPLQAEVEADDQPRQQRELIVEGAEGAEPDAAQAQHDGEGVERERGGEGHQRHPVGQHPAGGDVADEGRGGNQVEAQAEGEEEQLHGRSVLRDGRRGWRA